jgi:hypothetical protein
VSNHLPLRDKVSALVDLADMIGLPLELVQQAAHYVLGIPEPGDE